MVRIEFLCISSFQPNRSSHSKSQEGEVFGDHDYTMVENTVFVSNDGIITEKFPDTSSSKHPEFAILAILHLCLLRYFPSTNLVDRAGNCYTSLYFYFSSFSMFIRSRISKLVVICSCCSFLLSIFFILLFSTLLSIPCSVFSLCLFTLFSDLPYGFLFKSVILSFVFSYYSVLSASPLCSVPIQSVLFLLVFILLDTSI